MKTKGSKSKSKSGGALSSTADAGPPITDPRFKHVASDPKFRSMHRKDRKVVIDDRFKSMLTDDRFKLKSAIDKRGRPQPKDASEDLRRFYELESDASDDEEEKKKEKSGESDDDDPIEIDLARGDGNVSSSSDSEEEWELDGDRGDVDHGWGEMDKDARRSDSVSANRLAIVNMDWDRVQAKDIHILLSSFVPDNQGHIERVTVYVSDFGKERLQQEAEQGPGMFVREEKEDDSSDSDRNSDDSESDDDPLKKTIGDLAPGTVLEDDDDATKGDTKQVERIRRYQLDRLRYYYAVVETDCAATAEAVYKACDGVEFETSSTKVDLRFVDDSTEFDEANVKGRYTADDSKSALNAKKYDPVHFTTSALQMSHVRMTWDETDPRRQRDMRSAFTEAGKERDTGAQYTGEDAWRNYVASGNSTRTKLLALLGDKFDVHRNKSRPMSDEHEGMEVTWSGTLGDDGDMVTGGRGSGDEQESGDDSSNSGDESDAPDRATVDDLAALVGDGEEDSDEGEDREGRAQLGRRGKKSKKVEKVENTPKFNVDTTDDRFAALYDNPAFNIDPTDPKFKRTDGMDRLIDKKIARSQQKANEVEEASTKRKEKPKTSTKSSLSALMASVKRKATDIQSTNAKGAKRRAK